MSLYLPLWPYLYAGAPDLALVTLEEHPVTMSSDHCDRMSNDLPATENCTPKRAFYSKIKWQLCSGITLGSIQMPNPRECDDGGFTDHQSLKELCSNSK